MVVWDKSGKIIEVPFTVGTGTACVCLESFLKWSRAGLFCSWSRDGIFHVASS